MAAAGSGPSSDVPDTGDVPDEGDVSDGTRTALPIIDDPARSPDPSVCPFFRRELDGLLVVPLLVPDDANRCVAVGAPRPQASHQQELVCLRSAHTDCPRYLRGALVVSDAPAARRPVAVPRATLAALLVLVLSAGISFGFVVQRGGIDLPVVEGGATPTALAVVTTPPPAATMPPASPQPTVAPTPIAAASATFSPTPAPAPSPTPAPTPSSTPAPTQSPTPSPTPSATPAPASTAEATPTSTRYALLKPCPDRKNCWIYRVRSGDNLFSIANYFGHPLSTIYRWNPRYPETRLRTGDPIRMPPPTR